MKIIVQKFGGTSVATDKSREMIVSKVADAIERGYKPIVVVSAMGRKGDNYSTDSLLSLISNKDCNKRDVDLLMSCGEIISAVVVSETFIKLGYRAAALTGGNAGIVTDDNYGSANVISVQTERILGLLNDGIIPVVTGFQGMTHEGDFTTLGRGGSDVTAAVLGTFLGAERVEIYTDVDGVMTADPRIVADARVINKISYNKVFQLADEGAKVIHPRAVEYAMKGNVPLIIRNTMSEAEGTMITSLKENENSVVTGITHMTNRTQFSVNIDESLDEKGDIFEILAYKNISIDLINVFPNRRVFTVDGGNEKKVEEVINQIGLNYKMVKNCSKVALVGNEMRGIPGVMAKILKILGQNNIRVLQTADSHTTIWCLVKEGDTVNAVNVLHRAFCY